MQRLLKQNQAQMAMVGSAIGLFITLLITVLIFYAIAPSAYHTSTSTQTHAQNVTWNQNNNATVSTMNQAATFFTIAPIVGIVIVAVVVIGYVQRIGGGG